MIHWSLPVAIGLTITILLLLTYKVIYGAETTMSISEYVKEIKYQTCHTTMDIYNLSSYYECIGEPIR